MKRRLVQIECEDYLSAYIVLNSGVPLDVRDNYSWLLKRRHLSVYNQGVLYISVESIFNEINFVPNEDANIAQFRLVESSNTLWKWPQILYQKLQIHLSNTLFCLKVNQL